MTPPPMMVSRLPRVPVKSAFSLSSAPRLTCGDPWSCVQPWYGLAVSARTRRRRAPPRARPALVPRGSPGRWSRRGSSGAGAGVRAGGGTLRGERPGQLRARVQAELAVDVPQVVLDGLRAEEQGRRGLPGRAAGGEQERDLQFLRRELLDGTGGSPAQRLAGRRELGPRAVGPRAGAQALERRRGRAELLA